MYLLHIYKFEVKYKKRSSSIFWNECCRYWKGINLFHSHVLKQFNKNVWGIYDLFYPMFGSVSLNLLRTPSGVSQVASSAHLCWLATFSVKTALVTSQFHHHD